MRKYLETAAVVMQLIILLAVALFWWNRVNEDWDNGIVLWINNRYYDIRSFVERFLAGPRAQQFEAWSKRYWGQPQDTDE